VLSQRTDRGIHELCSTFIDNSSLETTESHTIANIEEKCLSESSEKTFMLTFSTSMLLGSKKSKIKKARFEVEIVDVKKAQVLARSIPFSLSDIVKNDDSSRTSVWAPESFALRFNNLIATAMSKAHLNTFSHQYAFPGVQ
jgi:hypothetical protein